MQRTDPATILAERLIGALRGLTPPGAPSGILLSLAELAKQAIPEATAEQIHSAIKKKAFAGQVVTPQPRNLDSPVALKEDAARLLASDRLFLFLLKLTCTPTKPVIDPAKLRMKLPAALRPAWDDMLRDRIAKKELPESELVVQGKKRLLHCKAWPLPKKPEEKLADEAVERLRAWRGDGQRYPTTLAALQRAVDPHASPGLWKKAQKTPAFAESVLLATTAQPNAPVTLTADRERLLEGDLLLGIALERSRSARHQVVSLAELKQKAKRDLQADFGAALERRVVGQRLPAGVGCLLQKGRPVFFRLDDLNATQRPPENVPHVATVDARPFAMAFEAAFAELDQRRGGHNFVSLVELRTALAQPRERFDQELQRLRLAGRYTLSAAEGRHGIGPEEQSAAIVEDGALLLYVSRRK